MLLAICTLFSVQPQLRRWERDEPDGALSEGLVWFGFLENHPLLCRYKNGRLGRICGCLQGAGRQRGKQGGEMELLAAHPAPKLFYG